MSEIKEAIEEIMSWTPILLGMGSKCTVATAKAQEMAINALREVEQYHAIGTLDKCMEAIEKQIPKKLTKKPDIFCDLILHYYCPSCGLYLGQRGVHNVMSSSEKDRYCQGERCGQALDWSDEE